MCQFGGWEAPAARLAQLRTGRGPESPGADFLYVHEDYRVTDGIFPDETIVLDNPTNDWIEFCQEKLKFAVPSTEQ